MLIHKVWGAIALTICLQNLVNAAGICGNATIRKHWSDCRKFVECGESNTIVFQCPERSYFNPETLVCDFSMYAECVVDHEVDEKFFAEQRMFESAPGTLVTIATCNEHPLGAKLSHPDYCNMFYHCSPSGPILFECPANLHFCPKRLVCNWPQFVDCVGQDTPGPIIPPGDGSCPANCIPDNRCPIDCYPDLHSTVLPHPSRCDAFLRCRAGCACFEYCAPGLYWSTFLGRCVERYRSECDDVVIPDCPEYNCVPSELCPPIDDPDNPIRFPHPERCDAYKKCFSGQACTIECPEGLEFNPEIGECDISWGCEVTPSTPIPTTPDATELPTTEPPITQPPTTQPPITQPPITQPPTTQPPITQPPTTQPPITQPPTTQPPITQPPTTQPPITQPPTTQPPITQPPTTQPPITQPPTTQPPITQPPTTQPPITQPPTTQPPITQPPTTQPPTTQPPGTPPPCPICPPGICKPDDRCPIDPCLECNPVFLPHPDDCEKFLKCTHGYACEMQCPPGLHWSSAMSRCEWPANGDCAGGGIPDEPPADVGCPFDDRCMLFEFYRDPILLPYPNDCTKFVSCISSQHGCVKDCPGGLHWSISHNRCEWPNRAGCDPTIPPEDDCPTCPCIPCRQRQDLHPCVENSYCSQNFNTTLSLPYQKQCDRFYKCLNGFACLLDCPDGTHYSSQSQHCVDPNIAKCNLN
ncbi:uncharacterized protein LOC135707750 [Ochlerotatus camptorhynchus]|uniref:uncharacterized protein LOC135707750 n=1 Tax=Ochlerotatus camptorhynchus TaxID=644619 RepID=UPI0031DC4652